MDHVYLTGIKHSGKSSVGRAAARLLDMGFTDTDDLIVSSLPQGVCSIRQLYREHGKEAFMACEHEALAAFLATAQKRRHLIATGGGACDNGQLVGLMRRTGKIIYLFVEEEVLFKRIISGGLPPFLEGPDPRSAFARLYAHRDARYRQISDYVVSLSDYRSVPENARILADRLRKLTGSEDVCLETPLEPH